MSRTRHYELAADEQLVLWARAGDDEAIESLLHRLSPLVHACAQHYGGPAHELGDRRQVCRIAVFNAIRKWPLGSRSFRAYAIQAMRRAVIDLWAVETRQHKRLRYASQLNCDDGEEGDWTNLCVDPTEADTACLAHADAAPVATIVRNALNAQLLAAVALTADGCDQAEIAEALGIATGTVKSRLWLARRLVEAALKAGEEDTT